MYSLLQHPAQAFDMTHCAVLHCLPAPPSPCSNALCVFELSLGQPLLRHWADAGGSPSYYGGVQGSVLVLRSISTVYNYDYIAVSIGVTRDCTGHSRVLLWQ